MPDMRIALIDLGTNSVRFDIHEILNGKAVRVYREKIMLRLGDTVFTEKKISSEAFERTIKAFSRFRETADRFAVEHALAVGTSAVRDANNAEELVNKVREQSGFELRVISGEEEATLIAHGVVQNEGDLGGSFALIDIGGGSTEISVCIDRRIERLASFHLGALRLHQLFLKTTPPAQSSNGPNPVQELRHHIRNELSSRIILEGWPPVKRLIGSSGTVRALAKIGDRVSKSTVERDFLKKLVIEMTPMNRDQLLNIPGIEPKRVDIILAGAILLEEILGIFQAEKISITEHSLRDGLLDTALEAIRKDSSSIELAKQHTRTSS
jgi:exopolyphosphatase/guanosine-5'-triphosphate,3'-diphosphate pyrophosphatase